MSDKKYTLTEVGVGAVVAPVVFALAILLAFPFTMWVAYVGMVLWNWFPAVYFHLQPISFWMMIGIIYATSIFRFTSTYKDHEVDWKKELSSLTLGPAILLGIGYLIHLKLQ